MLDSETKRRIDTCRDILVGKVPDPKSQVEQITIALIYKFMNDMDIGAEELGGERKYFTSEFAKYAWANLVASGMGGHEMLALYGEAITKMSENTSIPQLFRDIFKNAYLPYRDPETLRSFLKEIDSFKYDHSERLGDAFEYLLSVLGSQGDAGQFRTPRHIIDFMVEVVDPQKDDVILDPACGTAGFLISAYKHILKHNSSDYKAAKDKEAYDEKGVPVESLTLESPMRFKGDLLTPDDRKKLANDIKGYDISPDMVRLSLVNMYLHGFPDPDIVEYDTLTSEEKWNDYADVILANPPFMTPKGGIRPHKRFSITASRSEVLFVDYIAEHLTPNGRAAIVVPEGIIFQSGGAYKQLREMLVKNSLIAVISLPAGVFNPYSGVKTSILVLDKRLAKKTNNILFVKIENDGYGLGAQRRPIDKNDLPAAVRGLREYVSCLQNGKEFETERRKNFSVVSKDKIAESGDYNLGGDRYGATAVQSNQYPMVALGEVVDILDSRRKPITKSDRKAGPYPYYGATGVLDYVESYIFDEDLVLVGEDGAKWSSGEKTAFAISGKTWVNNHAHVLRPKREVMLDVYLIEILNQMDLNPFITGVTVPKLNQEKLRSITIPLPPIDVQREIVAEIEGYQKIIDGAKQIVAAYQPRVPLNPDWPILEFDKIVTTITPPQKIQKADYKVVGKYPIIDQSQDEIAGWTDDTNALIDVKGGTVIFGDHTCAIKYAEKPFAQGADGIKILKTFDVCLPKFLYYYLIAYPVVSDGYKRHFGDLKRKSFSIPSQDIQKSIVAEIEKEQTLVNGNKELIRLFEAKIQAAINRVWGKAE